MALWFKCKNIAMIKSHTEAERETESSRKRNRSLTGFGWCKLPCWVRREGENSLEFHRTASSCWTSPELTVHESKQNSHTGESGGGQRCTGKKGARRRRITSTVTYGHSRVTLFYDLKELLKKNPVIIYPLLFCCSEPVCQRQLYKRMSKILFSKESGAVSPSIIVWKSLYERKIKTHINIMFSFHTYFGLMDTHYVYFIKHLKYKLRELYFTVLYL